jgi:hypothetical protein
MHGGNMICCVGASWLDLGQKSFAFCTVDSVSNTCREPRPRGGLTEFGHLLSRIDIRRTHMGDHHTYRQLDP